VTIYEILTRHQPFSDSYTADVVREVCFEAVHVPIPKDCNPILAEVMRDCFQQEPNDRPTFEVIVTKLEKLYYT